MGLRTLAPRVPHIKHTEALSRNPAQLRRLPVRCVTSVRPTTSVDSVSTSAGTKTDPQTKALTAAEIEELAIKCALEQGQMAYNPDSFKTKPEFSTLEDLAKGYERCKDVTAFYAKTFYLGTTLMDDDRQRAIWAIYLWCRRTDELVDGPNADRITPTALDMWEQRLEDVFEGRPYDILDATLSDTVRKFPLGIQPFRDMVAGMRDDLVKCRYQVCSICQLRVSEGFRAPHA